MKKGILILIGLLFFSVNITAQRPSQINSRCLGLREYSNVSITRFGNIELNSCAGRTVSINGNNAVTSTATAPKIPYFSTATNLTDTAINYYTEADGFPVDNAQLYFKEYNPAEFLNALYIGYNYSFTRTEWSPAFNGSLWQANAQTPAPLYAYGRITITANHSSNDVKITNTLGGGGGTIPSIWAVQGSGGGAPNCTSSTDCYLIRATMRNQDNRTIRLGDASVFGNGNRTFIDINDTVTDRSIFLNALSSIGIGDTLSIGNDTLFTLNDTLQTISLSAVNGITFNNPIIVNNDCSGNTSLIGGTVTINSTCITATANVQVTYRAPLSNAGILAVGNIVAGTSFDITSTNGADTSDIDWFITQK